MSEIKAVIFDLFGTLIYLSDETKPYIRLFNELGLTTREEIRIATDICITNYLPDVESIIDKLSSNPMLKINDVSIDFEKYGEMIKEEKGSALIYEDSMAVLKNLERKNLDLILISNLATPYTDCFYETGLNQFNFRSIVFSCDVGFKKPQECIYELGRKGINVENSEILMVGDKLLNDVEIPKKLKMRALHLNRDSDNNASIKSLNQVLDYV